MHKRNNIKPSTLFVPPKRVYEEFFSAHSYLHTHTHIDIQIHSVSHTYNVRLTLFSICHTFFFAEICHLQIHTRMRSSLDHEHRVRERVNEKKKKKKFRSNAYAFAFEHAQFIQSVVYSVTVNSIILKCSLYNTQQSEKNLIHLVIIITTTISSSHKKRDICASPKKTNSVVAKKKKQFGKSVVMELCCDRDAIELCDPIVKRSLLWKHS